MVKDILIIKLLHQLIDKMSFIVERCCIKMASTNNFNYLLKFFSFYLTLVLRYKQRDMRSKYIIFAVLSYKLLLPNVAVKHNISSLWTDNPHNEINPNNP